MPTEDNGQQDGMIKKQVPVPGKGIDERADQLAHDPPNTDDDSMNDTQEKLR